jgi:hypothetical protein
MIETPPGWDDDVLASYFENAWRNVLSRFHNERYEYRRLKGIDSLFLRMVTGWINPEDVAVAPLVYRAHAAFRAAVQLTLSGQLGEAYMVSRGALEIALYANHISAHSELYPVWLGRVSSDQGKKESKAKFKMVHVKESLANRDNTLASRVSEIYDRTIDYGAHPNAGSVLGAIELEDRGEDGGGYNITYLADEGDGYTLAWRTTATIGLLCIDIFAHVFPERCRETEVLKVAAMLKTGL